jgi:hypothetical protein
VKKKERTVEELLAQLNEDPAFRKRAEEQKRRQVAQQEAFRQAEAPLVRDLNMKGVAVQSVADLVNSSRAYPAAIPVLLEHLQRGYPERVREMIARALAVPEARWAWDILLDLFVSNPSERPTGLKWALGCALAGAADDSVLGDVIQLVRDKRHGQNRAALFYALEKSRKPEARGVLLELRHDPQLAQAVRQVLRGDLKK